jgi:hypothetical protein
LYLETIALGTLGLVISLGVHELGHLVVGLLVRFRFYLFALGPIAVERREPSGIKIRWNREPAFWGGVAGTLPMDSVRLTARFAAVVAGGPVASLLLAAGAAGLLHFHSGLVPSVRIELVWLRLLSFLLFLGTALPLPNGAFVTDGLRFFRLLRKGALADREQVMLMLCALQLSGVRPRNWDDALIGRGLRVRDGSMFEWQLHLFAYLRALDTGAFESAGQALDQAMALNVRVPPSARTHCVLEVAFFEAAHRCNAMQARSLLNGLPRHGFGALEANQLRVRAAVAIAEGHREAAQGYIENALHVLPAWDTWSHARLEELASAAKAI